MKLNRVAAALGFAMLAAACGRNNDKQADAALQNDLSLAAQQQPGRMDSVSALENGYANAPASSAPRSTAVRRSTSSSYSTRRSSSGSRGSYSSSGSATASAPRTVTQKHTKRDAAIGAAAGAVIGATTSRDKVKGGIIGAAAGGILGAVIGNNVDVHKKPQP